jgi:hypothetical protein
MVVEDAGMRMQGAGCDYRTGHVSVESYAIAKLGDTNEKTLKPGRPQGSNLSQSMSVRTLSPALGKGQQQQAEQ